VRAFRFFDGFAGVNRGLAPHRGRNSAYIPIGTVMSRLSRARRQFQAAVARREQAGSTS